MSDYPIFTIDCKGCGRRGRTSRLTEPWTVEYCPDCQKRRAASARACDACRGMPDHTPTCPTRLALDAGGNPDD